MKTTANRILEVYLELKDRQCEWNTCFDTGSSMSILYQQFISLSKQINFQFEFSSPNRAVQEFGDGSFIQKRGLEEYNPILTQLVEYNPYMNKYVFWKRERYKYWQLESLYGKLIEFRLCTDFRYSGALEGIAVGGDYGHYLRTEAIDKAKLAQINEILSLIIDPAQTVFNVPLLIEQFDYPTQDYESKYLDERSENA